MHKDAPLAHVASLAAHEQGKFWEYHDKLFQSTSKLKRPDLEQYARELKLDTTRFEQALNTMRGKDLIDADKAEASALGVTGTPGFFVNGRFLSGAKPFEEFATVINAELKRLNISIPTSGS
jgi:protein-disulfide isomerase